MKTIFAGLLAALGVNSRLIEINQNDEYASEEQHTGKTGDVFQIKMECNPSTGYFY